MNAISAWQTTLTLLSGAVYGNVPSTNATSDTNRFHTGMEILTPRNLSATGASPTELLEFLRRRELIEPLPESAQGVLDLVNEAIRRDGAEAVVSAAAQAADPQAGAPDQE